MNTRRRLAQMLFAALAPLMVHEGAHAQAAARPVLSVGDTWQFAVYYTVPSRVPNRTWTITAVTPELLRGTENGEPLVLTAELNVVDTPRTSESNARLLSFPLEVGKRWSYRSEWHFKPKGSRGTIDTEVSVVSHESIEVPAGTFIAFRLVASGELGGLSPTGTFYGGRTTTTYWYAPDAKAVVKSEHHNPFLGSTTVELVGYRLQP